MGSIYKTKSLPRRGYRTQPRVSTLGTRLRRNGARAKRPIRSAAQLLILRALCARPSFCL
jgi:hypothetical protein